MEKESTKLKYRDNNHNDNKNVVEITASEKNNGDINRRHNDQRQQQQPIFVEFEGTKMKKRKEGLHRQPEQEQKLPSSSGLDVDLVVEPKHKKRKKDDVKNENKKEKKKNEREKKSKTKKKKRKKKQDNNDSDVEEDQSTSDDKKKTEACKQNGSSTKQNDGYDASNDDDKNKSLSNRRSRNEQIMKQHQEEETRQLLSSLATSSSSFLENKNETDRNYTNHDESTLSSLPNRLVASSAVEFYDPDVIGNCSNFDKGSSLQLRTKTTAASSSLNDDDEDHNKSQAQQKQKLPVAARKHDHSLTLLLFYQYVEPVWDESTYAFMLTTLQKIGRDLDLTGRMRVAREGLNCTLTASHDSILEYCNTLRRLRPDEFCNTEFKLTTDLPLAQKFPNLKVFKVVELVHYGLEGTKAPPITKYHGTHLEPKDYHRKIAEPNTVIIDVRNHYEAAIGRFVPPQEAAAGTTTSKAPSSKKTTNNAASDLAPPKWLDPKMRKSTEFPAWLDRPETKEEMKGKQVLMYCTGGIRCERASALLKYKMETDPDIKALGIQGVYQLQGGIDKYFKEFPDGGYWQGKNYVFDKRFAHAPPKIDGELHGRKDKAITPIGEEGKQNSGTRSFEAPNTQAAKIPPPEAAQVMGRCEACGKPWDMYRGKRRCPTCGVPSLICKDCFLADKEGRKMLDREVRCDLCVEQGIKSKRELRQRDELDIQQYEARMAAKGLLQPNKAFAPNPGGVTRLFLKNMCRKKMDETTLMEALPGITHIVWRSDRKSGKFLGSSWVEMATPEDAARAVAQDGKLRLFGRPVSICFQAPDGKDAWPPPNSAVGGGRLFSIGLKSNLTIP